MCIFNYLIYFYVSEIIVPEKFSEYIILANLNLERFVLPLLYSWNRMHFSGNYTHIFWSKTFDPLKNNP